MGLKSFKKAEFFIPVIIALTGIFFCLSSCTKASVPKENFESFKISYEALSKIIEVSELCGTDTAEAISCYMLENNFFEEKQAYSEDEIRNFFKNYDSIKAGLNEKELKAYSSIINNVFDDIKTFPVSTKSPEKYYYGDSYGTPRTYGGKRIHKGTDIFDSENIRGRLTVVSMTDGVVEKIGWNKKGGYRVGIRSENNIYYYYAHLVSYAEGLDEGTAVTAGTALGLMGGTVYGKKEGTRGNFPVHLHIGISPKTSLYRGKVWLNPYPFLRCIEEGII